MASAGIQALRDRRAQRQRDRNTKRVSQGKAPARPEYGVNTPRSTASVRPAARSSTTSGKASAGPKPNAISGGKVRAFKDPRNQAAYDAYSKRARAKGLKPLAADKWYRSHTVYKGKSGSAGAAARSTAAAKRKPNAVTGGKVNQTRIRAVDQIRKAVARKPTPKPTSNPTPKPTKKPGQIDLSVAAKILMQRRPQNNYERLAIAAHKAGFRGDALRMAVAVAAAESTVGTNLANPTSNARGPWQIMTSVWGGDPNRHINDWDYNARRAKEVYDDARRWHPHGPWGPWEAYTRGMHGSHLGPSDAAVRRLGLYN